MKLNEFKEKLYEELARKGVRHNSIILNLTRKRDSVGDECGFHGFLYNSANGICIHINYDSGSYEYDIQFARRMCYPISETRKITPSGALFIITIVEMLNDKEAYKADKYIWKE